MQANFPNYQILRSPLPLIRAGSAEMIQRLAFGSDGAAVLRLSGDTLTVTVEGAAVSSVHLALHSGLASSATILLGQERPDPADPVPSLWVFDLAAPRVERGAAIFGLRLAAVSAPTPEAPQIDGMTLPWRQAWRADLEIVRPSWILDMPAPQPVSPAAAWRAPSPRNAPPAPARPCAPAAPARPSAHRAAAPTGSRS
jgi:hypothetical protein